MDGLSKNSLMQQNIELRKRLDDEHSHYKAKLQSYQDSQQRQAQLVQKLQSKVSSIHFRREAEFTKELMKEMGKSAMRNAMQRCNWQLYFNISL